MHHEGENVFHINKVTLPGPELPHCCLELQGLHMQRYSSRPGEFKEPYVTGYMVPYSDNNWADWFKRFTLQTLTTIVREVPGATVSERLLCAPVCHYTVKRDIVVCAKFA